MEKMRDLQLYADYARGILDDLHIPYGNVVEITINTRARRWGQCRKIPAGYSININQTLLDLRNSEDGLINTLLHELLHTCPDCMNHGAIWKKYAELVRKNWGYDVKRTSDCEDKGVTTGNQNIIQRKIRYIVTCEKCGYEWHHSRRCKSVDNVEAYRCFCGGKLNLVEV